MIFFLLLHIAVNSFQQSTFSLVDSFSLLSKLPSKIYEDGTAFYSGTGQVSKHDRHLMLYISAISYCTGDYTKYVYNSI